MVGKFEEKNKKKTKIVCTIGPSSKARDTLCRMFEAGMDIVRLNSGHMDVEDVGTYIEEVRSAEEKLGGRISVMLDLQGPRLRVGPIKGSGVKLEKGENFTITTVQRRGDESRVSVSYQGLPRDLNPGEEILIDDGLIRLKVLSIEGTDINCEVVEGGLLRQGKGMNFPKSSLSLPPFTERDMKYLEAGLSAGVDWVSQSFVRSAGDVHELKSAISRLGYDTPVMAKIEKGEAVKAFESIIDEADGVMIARGDLAVETSTEEVPLVQKELIKRALRRAKPVVTATQMLESMVTNPRPTRAEASDVANAILDGTDAVMLSAETAIGSYPVKAVETMARIAKRAEEALDFDAILNERRSWAGESIADAICYAASKISSDLRVSSILTITRTGYSAIHLSRFRPKVPIIAACNSESVVRRLSVIWGVEAVKCEFEPDFRATIRNAVERSISLGLLKKGELVVIVSGFLDEKAGTTNLVHIHRI